MDAAIIMVLVQCVQIITVSGNNVSTCTFVYFMVQNRFEFFYIKQNKIIIS